MKNTNEQVKPLLKDTYIAVIKNSLGSKTFQNFYAKVADEKRDIMRGGALSCAFFVSSITTLFGLTERIHGTVVGTENDLIESGWEKTEEPEVGSIIVWREIDFNGEKHKHIGFYIGEEQAISNSCFDKVPKQHHWTFVGQRKVQYIFRNEKLN